MHMHMQKVEEEREFDLASTEPETPLPLTVTSRVNTVSLSNSVILFFNFSVQFFCDIDTENIKETTCT